MKSGVGSIISHHIGMIQITLLLPMNPLLPQSIECFALISKYRSTHLNIGVDLLALIVHFFDKLAHLVAFPLLKIFAPTLPKLLQCQRIVPI